MKDLIKHSSYVISKVLWLFVNMRNRGLRYNSMSGMNIIFPM